MRLLRDAGTDVDPDGIQRASANLRTLRRCPVFCGLGGFGDGMGLGGCFCLRVLGGLISGGSG